MLTQQPRIVAPKRYANSFFFARWPLRSVRGANKMMDWTHAAQGKRGVGSGRGEGGLCTGRGTFHQRLCASRWARRPQPFVGGFPFKMIPQCKRPRKHLAHAQETCRMAVESTEIFSKQKIIIIIKGRKWHLFHGPPWQVGSWVVSENLL